VSESVAPRLGALIVRAFAVWLLQLARALLSARYEGHHQFVEVLICWDFVGERVGPQRDSSRVLAAIRMFIMRCALGSLNQASARGTALTSNLL
jgi:hypothetical protein